MRVISSSLLGLALALTSAAAVGAQTTGTTAPAAAATKTAPPAATAAPAACANPDALGLSKTLEIDTTGGPGFGLEQYKVHDFLQPKEVILTFDDGPQVKTTKSILETLANHCTKATFFSIGKMALGLPEILRDVAAHGHTIGSHTWSHADLGKLSKKDPKLAIEEFEKGLSGVHRALGGNVASFFRFPYLKDSKEMVDYLSKRNIAMFSMDADSFDFKNSSEQIVKTVMTKIEAKGKGIILMHDIQPRTAAALPNLLKALKDGGFKVVHLKSKTPATTLPEFDAMIEKDVRGLPSAGNEKPTSSIVRTVPNEP